MKDGKHGFALALALVVLTVLGGPSCGGKGRGGADVAEGLDADSGASLVAQDVLPADSPVAPTIDTSTSGAVDGADCWLPSALVFGYYGGMQTQESNTLDASGTLTITHTAERPVASCSWALPACGTPGAVTIATITTDLADADVQAAFAASSTPLYGVSLIPIDAADYSVALAGGTTVMVGAPCSSFPGQPCQPIPAGLLRLVDDLKSLAASALADPACVGLQ